MNFKLKFERIIIFLIAGLLTLKPLIAISDDGLFTNVLYAEGRNTLIEKYDFFSKGDKEYIVQFGGLSGRKYLAFAKSQNSNVIDVYSSWVIAGDEHRPAMSSRIEVRFDDEYQIYDLGGNAEHLYTIARIDKLSYLEFMEKLASKTHMYVKVHVIGRKYVFKVALQGADEMLRKGGFYA